VFMTMISYSNPKKIREASDRHTQLRTTLPRSYVVAIVTIQAFLE